jgi:hypothetical protein
MELADPYAYLRPIRQPLINGDTGAELNESEPSPLDPVEIFLLAHLGVSPTIIDLLLSELNRSSGDPHD